MITKIKRILGNVVDFFRITRGEELAKLIKDNNYSSYAEIGVWDGYTVKYLLRKCKLIKVICVDDYQDNNQFYSHERVIKAKEKGMKLDNYPNLFFYNTTSKEASKKVKDNSLDIIFIDANHSYKSIKEDIKLWYPKVRKGGMLCGHSYRIRWLGVMKAVTEKFSYFKLLNDDVWMVKKLK